MTTQRRARGRRPANFARVVLAGALLLGCSSGDAESSASPDGSRPGESDGSGDGHGGAGSTDRNDAGEPVGGGGSSATGGADAGESDGQGGSASADAAGGSAAGAGSGAPPPAVITETPPDAELATADGCTGVYNPDQLLTLALEFASGDFSKVLADTTYAVVVPALMQCGDEEPLTVGVRRKRSGGQRKVGLKIDINAIVPGQRWYGLKKLSLENGVSEGDSEDGAEVRAYVAEYLAWRSMVLSGAISSRAAFVSLRVDGESLGVYLNLEQVDKRFLEQRLGDDSGFLYKKSGGVNDGLKTNELGAGDNTFDDYFCFWASGQSCALPDSAALEAELPLHLDIPQFLRFGAVNAFIANTDGPLFKDNNYYYYDYASGPRVYIAWDLDTAMKDSTSVFTGGGGGGGMSDFHEVLFSHWQRDYTAILRELLDTHLTQAVIEAELDRSLLVAGDAFDADPYVSGTASEAVSALKQYWTGRLAAIEAEVP